MNKYSVTLYLTNNSAVTYTEEAYSKEDAMAMVINTLKHREFFETNKFQIVNSKRVVQATIKLIEEGK